MPQEIAIIGAGIAGLTAAQQLQNAGYNVVVFDKASRPGGRTCTRTMQTELGELVFDHGAPEFEAYNPAFTRKVADWAERGWVYESGPMRWVATPKMESLAKNLAEGLRVRTRERIVRAKDMGNSIQLEVNDGVNRDFDHVICAVPAEQAANLLKDVAPNLSTNAANVRSAPLWVAMLSFASPIAVSSSALDTLGGVEIARAIPEFEKRDRELTQNWTLHATRAFSDEFLEHEKSEIGPRMAEAFCMQLDIGLPDFVTAHRWRYCYPANPIGEPFLTSGRISVCGDWLLGGNVEGAWLSGKALARHIIHG